MTATEDALSTSRWYAADWYVLRPRLLNSLSVFVMWGCIFAARAVASWDNSEFADPLAAFLALPLLIIIPRQLGVLVWLLARQSNASLGSLERYIVQWLAGVTLLIVSLTIFTGIIGVPAEVATLGVLLLVSGCVFAGNRSSDDVGSRTRRSVWSRVTDALPYIVSLVLVAAPVTLIRLTEPYPMQVGWGLFSFNFRVLQFTETDHMAIAPGLHTPIHASLLGVTSIATGTAVEGLIWAAPVLLYASFALGVFVLTRRLSGSTLVALGSVWIAVWILSNTTFQHLHAVGMRGVFLALWPWILLVVLKCFPASTRKPSDLAPYFVYPLVALSIVGVIRWFLPSEVQPWALLCMVPVGLVAVRRLPQEIQQSVGLLTFVAAGMTFIHIIEGPLYVGLGLLFALALRWTPRSLSSRLVVGIALLAIATFITLQVADLLTFDDSSMVSRFLLGNARADAIPIPFDQKLRLMTLGLTYTFYALIGLSAVRLLIWPNVLHGAALGLVALALALYFLPESGLHRIMGPVIPLIGLCVVLELRWFARRLVGLRWKQEHALLSGALVVIAVVALTPHLTSSLREQVRLDSVFGLPVPRTEGDFSSVTAGEYEAIAWISENIPSDWVIVSDPMTMFLTQGLTLNPQVAQKRAWVAQSEYTLDDQERLYSVSQIVFGAPSTMAAREAMASLTEGHPGSALVISTRTLTWLLNPDSLFLRARPVDMLLEREPLESFCGYREFAPCPARFLDSEEFSLVYSRDNVAILVPTDDLTRLSVPSDN